MSWSIPFWYENKEELEEQSIGNWISSLFTPTINQNVIPLLLVIGGVLIVGYILFRKMRLI